ncbi:hypothetical protein Hanom_Chr11g01009221 [Helianthus anomalus]
MEVYEVLLRIIRALMQKFCEIFFLGKEVLRNYVVCQHNKKKFIAVLLFQD